MSPQATVASDFENEIRQEYGTILADPPWRFKNKTGKVAPEHKRLRRYPTLSLDEIKGIPVGGAAASQSHLYLWVPNALIAEGLETMAAWGFTYKANLIWYKIRKDGGPDGRGVGFYFRNVTEMVLFGVKGKLRTLPPARSQVNIMLARKREHSKKPDELYSIIESCSPGPYLEMFARGSKQGWDAWGNESDDYEISWPTYANNSEGQSKKSSQLRLGLSSKDRADTQRDDSAVEGP